MKKLLLAACFALLYIASTNGQTTNAFRVNYDQALFDLPGNAVEALTASNYVFAGTNLNFLPIYGTVTEVDNAGNLVWSKRYYDGSIGFQLNDVKRDDALNEYYLCGGSESNAAVFMRLDAAGNVTASTKFEISEADGAYFNRVIKTSDGGYVAVGYVIGHDPDGAGPEIYYGPITYTDNNGDSQTEYIGSPLIVKMDANGNHLWHHVSRYYLNPGKDPATDRIYNDASFVDVVEVADGYIAVGSYDVNQHNSATNSDGDDATPTDAIILKTTTAGAITYHKQFDNVDSNPSQSSKYFGAINKTSSGAPIAAGGANDGREWITKFAGSGGWSLTFSRLFTYSTFFGTPDPVDISQIYEVNGSTDLVTMGMYIKPLSFVFSNSIHRVNSTATSNVWAKYYTFGIGALLPRGSQVSDDGYLMLSMTSGVNWDYHLIKTDPNGDTPLASCAPTSFTPSASAGPTTIADPYYNAWSGTVGPQGLALLVANVTPTQTTQCSFITCTAPTISAQPTDVTMCATGSDNLSVTASGGPYQWQYNNGGTWENVSNGSPAGFTYTNSTTDNMTITTSGAAMGDYQFQVIAGSVGCETTSSTVTVTVPGATQLAPLGAQCSDVQLNFDAFPTSGATYAWTVTPPGGTSATPLSGTGQTFSYTPTNNTGSAQDFTVSVDVTYNGTTCTQNFTNTVNPVPTAPVVGTVTQPTCSVSTGSVDLSGLPASGTWTVTASPGGATSTGTGTTGTISGLTDNTSYTFTVTNSSGCTSSASISATIDPAPTIPSPPVIGAVTQTSCAVNTGNVQFSGLPSGTWTLTASPGGNTTTSTGSSGAINGLASGTYTFTVTNDQGCTSAATSSVTIDPAPPTPTAPIVGTITQPTCATATGSVDLSGLPGSGNWTLTANPGGLTQTGSGTTATFSGLTAGTTYTVTITNDAGCVSPPTSNIVIDPQPTTPTAPVIGTITQPTCAAPTGDIALSGLPATGNWTVTVNPGGGTFNGTGTSTTFTGLNPGTYTFTVTNDQGCTSSASTSATVDPLPANPSTPTGSITTQPTCSVPTGEIEVTAPLGANYEYSIDGSTFQSSTTFTGLAPGTYTITVQDINTGCSSTSASTYTINTAAGAPVITLDSMSDVTCNGGSDGEIYLTVSGATAPYTYVWTPNVGSSDDVTGLSAGSYTVVVTDALGCSSTDSWTIAEPTAIVSNGVLADADCSGGTGGSITTSASGGTAGYTYLWSPDNQTTSSISDLAAGNYSVTITDGIGCTTTENFTVGTNGSLNVTVTPDQTTIEAGSSVTLTATGATSYTWTPTAGLSCSNCSDPIATPSTTTAYIVVGMDSYGCLGADTALIVVESTCGEIYIPNIFSPNGEGPSANELLCVFGDCIEDFTFRIFNRWGEMVFETTDQETCWDGTYRNKEAMSGNFVYTIYAKLANGDVIEDSGNLTLIR